MGISDYHIWQTLLQTAIVGAGKAALPPPLLDHLSEKGLDMHTSAEEALLAASALTRMRIKAGRRFPLWEDPIPAALPVQSELINIPIGRHLSAILSGRFAPALREWIGLFASSGFSLPPEGLPGLLDRCLKEEGIRQMLEPHFGARARWLIAQNPAWAPLASPSEKKKVKTYPEPWSEEESMEWLARSRRLLAFASGDPKFHEAAYLIPARPGAPWLEGWEQIAPRTIFIWKNDLDYFLRVLRFRMEMRDAFKP